MVTIETVEPKRFDALRWELPPGVANLKVVDLLDQEIVITAIEPTITSFGDAVSFSFTLNGHELQALTHSVVLKKQFDAIANQLPVVATLRKAGRSYSLS
jgi:hypothetical protein